MAKLKLFHAQYIADAVKQANAFLEENKGKIEATGISTARFACGECCAVLYREITKPSIELKKLNAAILFGKSEEQSVEEQFNPCDGCEHATYIVETDYWSCDIDKEPHLDSVNPKMLFCKFRKEGIGKIKGQ